jgi:hypothetical protein
MRKVLLSIALLAAAVFSWAGASAETLPSPRGKSILEITGRISVVNTPEKTAIFDHEMLERIGVTKVQTSTPWTDGRPTFEGVLMRDLLKHVGATGDNVTVIALNDYKATLPVSDFEKYPVIIAHKMDGKLLKIRDKGPLWIIYPQDQFEELRDKSVNRKWVWQIKEIHVE